MCSALFEWVFFFLSFFFKLLSFRYQQEWCIPSEMGCCWCLQNFDILSANVHCVHMCVCLRTCMFVCVSAHMCMHLHMCLISFYNLIFHYFWRAQGPEQCSAYLPQQLWLFYCICFYYCAEQGLSDSTVPICILSMAWKHFMTYFLPPPLLMTSKSNCTLFTWDLYSNFDVKHSNCVLC